MPWPTKIEILNKNLAIAIDLRARLKHAHWNVTGDEFVGIHKLFDKLAESADGYADTLGEHIRFLGGEAVGTLKAVSTKTELAPYTVGIADCKDHLRAILNALTIALSTARDGIDASLTDRDQVSADVFIEISRGLGKDIYLVKSHLE